MEIFIYAVIFIIGTFCGSFFTLAVYRIPLKKNITHERSFCPNCHHKLGFLDLIPVLSYVFLGGKCRYCKQKIRSRYIIFEVLTGIVFVLFAMGIKIDLNNLQTLKLVSLAYGLLYISILFIISGIDKENHTVCNGALIFGLVISTMYIIYLYMLNVSIYKYVIYLILMFVFILINAIKTKKNKRQNYALEIFVLCMFMALGTDALVVIVGMILSLFLIAIKQTKIVKKYKIDTVNNVIPVAYYLCVTNILILVVQNINIKV